MKKVTLSFFLVFTLAAFSQSIKAVNSAGLKSATNTGTAAKDCKLSIGDKYQGGIIFYLDASGCHGLICALTDQSNGVMWWGGSASDTYAYGNGIGNGAGNTRSIIRWQPTPAFYAAKACYNTFIAGYNDWYLPSDYELVLMYKNVGQGNELGLGNIGAFGSKRYWSSSEHGVSVAWFTDFSTGAHDGDLKSKAFAVRACRIF